MVYAADINMKRKFKQEWLIIPPIPIKRIVAYLLKSLNIEKTTTYGIGNRGPSLGQGVKCGRVKPPPTIYTYYYYVVHSLLLLFLT